MSYDYVFWKGLTGGPSAREIYEQLREGHVDGLHPVDADAVRAAVGAALADWSRVDQDTWVLAADEHGNGPAVQLSFVEQGVFASCATSLVPAETAHLVDALRRLGFPAYDPQTGERVTPFRSVDLAFWQGDASEADEQVYQHLLAGEHVDGLAAVDAEQVERACADAFGKWERTGDRTWQHGVDPEGNPAAMELLVAPAGVVCRCCGLYPEQLNETIDVMVGLGMPLYDPQVGQRFA